MNFIYEINTRIWLRELSEKYKRDIKLGSVPEEELGCLKKSGFDALWLMGVWRSSAKGRQIALNDDELRRDFREALPDVKPDDIACSPYAIIGYEPDPSLGAIDGLVEFKERLHKKGLKLILDFIPNHLAVDHPWVDSNPGYFLHGTGQDLRDNPQTFFSIGNKIIFAHGKDPYFPAWSDVVQLNYFNPDTRQAMRDELLKVSSLCDGVRCDMAMLILKGIQRQIWGDRVFDGNKFNEPLDEFWQGAIAGIKQRYPEFIFIAEAYWGLEAQLISFGFDYAYDKSFYDALRDVDREKIRGGLFEHGELAHAKLRFIENHDESRALSAFGAKRSLAAALIMAMAPGAHLFYQGQMEGYSIKLPIQLVRPPKEEMRGEISLFYSKLLSNLNSIGEGEGSWNLLDALPAWEGEHTFRNFFLFFNRNSPMHLAVINYSDSRSQCYAPLDLADLPSNNVVFKDLLGSVEYVRPGSEIASRGLYLEMPEYGFHLFRVTGAD